MQPTAPQNIDAFQTRLRDIAEGLPKRMRECAEYLAAHHDRVAVSTVAEMAEGAGVPPSAMMRFCQIMGFKGFSEMQRLFRDAYVPGLPDYETRLANLRERGAGSPSALLAEFVDAGRISLENLTNSLDSRDLDQAVATLAAADTIHIIGRRRAFPVAAYLGYAFEKMQIAAVLHDGIGQMNQRGALREGDAVIAVTFAPNSQETIDLAGAALTKGLPVVAITDMLVGPLHVPGVVPLQVTEADFGAFRALSASLSLAITLAVAIGARRGADTEN